MQYRVQKMCKVLNVSTSGYYKWLKRKPSVRELRRKKLKKRIRHYYFHFKRRAGSPTITEALRDKGHKVSSKTVSRLMKEMGSKSIVVRKYKATTNSNHPMPVFENILDQKFQVDAPNKVWVSDITYIRTGEGWLYLASVMDLYARKIVSWSVGSRMTRELVYQTKFRTRKQAEKELYTYIEFDYNRLRLHSTLGYKTVHQFEQNYYKNIVA